MASRRYLKTGYHVCSSTSNHGLFIQLLDTTLATAHRRGGHGHDATISWRAHAFSTNWSGSFASAALLQAVKALKSCSGRGIDAISAAELQSLPDDAIIHLGQILSGYTTGFPAWLMIARTVALPKTSGVVMPSQIRPITILAQTYRLWSKVVCTAILRHFASAMPADITGLLKSRGPLDAAYRAQILHEIALSQATMEGGFSLDLIKCFNTIGQTQAVALLQSLGLPVALVEKWHASIQHLRRFWDLGSDHSALLPCTNGVPEGNTFSVVIMVAVAYAWVHSVKALAPSTRIGAYADNWGWATALLRDHPIIFDVTVRYVRAMGMEIDWHKSWYSEP